MNSKKNSFSKDNQIKDLQNRLSEAQANLEAITSGAADAIVVQNETGISIFTIQGAETAYRIMVDNMNEGALTVDAEGVILYVNPRFSTMIGIPSPLLAGKLVSSFITKHQQQGFKQFLIKTLTGSNVHQDFELIRKNGSTLPVYFSSAPLQLATRQDICIVASDLSERYVAEKKLMDLNNSLEKKVMERTRELEKQKKELVKSEKMLQKLTMSLEEQVEHRTIQVRNLAKALSIAEQKQRQRFSHILHEDLQQVLYSAKARFDLLKDTVESGPSEEVTEDIGTLEQLVSKALATSKRLAIEFNPPTLENEGLDKALHWLAYHMEKQYGLKVEISTSDSLQVIHEDERVMLVQLVQELLLNVVKHAGTGKAIISATRDNRHIFIKIEDRGIGFDVNKEREIAQEKTHMGLFSIQERLRLFGGEVQIESTAGKGTSVIMVMPYDPKSQQLSVE